MKAYSIIKRPVLTEKSYAGIPSKKYVFIVDPSSTKPQIKEAVEQLFGVNVEKVHTVSVKGKFKRQGKTSGYTSDYKKAYVELSEGSKTIEFFDSLQ